MSEVLNCAFFNSNKNVFIRQGDKEKVGSVISPPTLFTVSFYFVIFMVAYACFPQHSKLHLSQ